MVAPFHRILYLILAGSHLVSCSPSDPVCSAGSGSDDVACAANTNPRNGPSGSRTLCEDKHKKCKKWAQAGKCETDGKETFEQCPHSCEACDCKDNHEECGAWAKLGECTANPAYMLNDCKRSCHYCRKGLKPPRAEVDPAVGESGECRDLHGKCTEWADKGECAKNPKYMLVQCPVQCGVCQSGDPHPSLSPNCQDKRADCFDRASKGHCHSHSGLMLQDCQRSCRICGKNDPCGPNISDVGVLDRAGALSALFERVISIENVTVLHRDPYVVLIHDMFSSMVIDDVQKLFGSYWEPSRIGGVPGADTTGSRRTSEQQWCRAECEATPVMRKVTQRIEAMLGIARRRYEDLQILRYLPGQEYMEHHDYIDEQIYFPCGPRILTLFLYLNDVHEGGETAWPKLNVSVSPRKGAAVLWPHVLDDDPLLMDKRTVHFGLPPLGDSTKYAMNFWVHQFDFRRYNLNHCLQARRPRSSYYIPVEQE